MVPVFKMVAMKVRKTTQALGSQCGVIFPGQGCDLLIWPQWPWCLGLGPGVWSGLRQPKEAPMTLLAPPMATEGQHVAW